MAAAEGDELVTRSWRKILCAVDFFGCSREALALAGDLSRRLGAELVIAHVLEARNGNGETATDAERALARIALEAHQYTDQPIRTALLAGSPVTELVRLADEGGFDLLVTGTHGRNGLPRIVLGSVALGIVSRARCPVLVARKRPEVAANAPAET